MPNFRRCILLILLVGAGRFELPTPCAQGRCATRLRYAPTSRSFLDFRRLPGFAIPLSGCPSSPRNQNPRFASTRVLSPAQTKVVEDYVARMRLIWIRDRWNGHYERYGSIVSTAPLRSVATVVCRVAREDCDLTITLVSGESWRIPLSPRTQAEAEMFSQAFAARFSRENG